MRSSRDADGALVLTYDSSRWTKALMVLAAVFLATGAYDVFVGARGTERMVGLVGAASTCLLSGILLLEKVRFRFDPERREIVWDRRWALRRRKGATAFADVANVLVEIPIGDDGVPSRRITLQRTTGGLLPITVGYRPDTDGEILRVAGEVREILGMNSEASLSESLRVLVERDRILDAIRLLREREGISLTDAKLRIDSLRDSLAGATRRDTSAG